MKVTITGILIDGHPLPMTKFEMDPEKEFLTLSTWNQATGAIKPQQGVDILMLVQKNGWKLEKKTLVPPKPKENEAWVIEFTSPDPALEFTTAYKNRSEAIEDAICFIKRQAEEELDGTEWTNPEAPRLLRKTLKAISKGDHEDAIGAWLEFQEEFDPSEKIALGPSGQVSARNMDFKREGS